VGHIKVKTYQKSITVLMNNLEVIGKQKMLAVMHHNSEVITKSFLIRYNYMPPEMV